MALAIKKVSDDSYQLFLSPPDVERDWSPPTPLSGRQIVQVLAQGGYHPVDVCDLMSEQDPNWSQKLRGPALPQSDDPEISIPGVFPMLSRQLGMADGNRCIPSIYRKLREIRLRIPGPEYERVKESWRAAGINVSESENEPVQVVMMDRHLGNGTISTLTNARGAAEMLFSDDSGCYGGQIFPEFRKAGLCAIAAANEALSHFRPTATFDLPPMGSVAFYIRAKEGLLTASATEYELKLETNPLHPLIIAMQEIFEAYRRAFPK